MLHLVVQGTAGTLKLASSLSMVLMEHSPPLCR